MTEPLVPRDDVRATLEARRELGLEREEELVDAFVARIERRLEERTQRAPKPHSGNTGGVVLGIASLALAIPLIAVPAATIGGFGGAFGVVAVCVLLIVINALYWEKSR